MKRATIIVKGRVQRVGYRDFVAEIANGLNICGIAKNLPDGTVRIVAEAEEEILEQFIALIEPRDDPMIKVTNVNVKFEPATGEFEYFDIEYVDFQQEGFERIGVAAVYLKRIDKRIVNIDKKQDSMLEKQDVVIEKHDETINELKAFRKESGKKQDQMLQKEDLMVEKHDETISIMKSGVDEMQEFRTETQQNFATLDTKYGKVAENMERILEEMKEERKESRESMEKILNAILKLVEKSGS